MKASGYHGGQEGGVVVNGASLSYAISLQLIVHSSLHRNQQPDWAWLLSYKIVQIHFLHKIS